jgi:type I restriction enzyme R subunit
VEQYSKPEAWEMLSTDQLTDLAENVSGLPTELADEDEDAKRFDLLMLRTQLSLLKADTNFANLRDRVKVIASALEDQQAIPAIKARLALIQAVAGEEWWEDVTATMLESARKQLRALIKLIDKTERRVVYTDFEDELGDGTLIDLPDVGTGMNLERFCEKARQFLKAHESNISLQRLKRNQPLTASDLDQLEHMLLDAGGTQELIDRAKVQSNGLGFFIRSLVGLDHETAKQAFSQFISGTAVSASQIEFINLVVNYLTENGIMEADRLYESPFTDINPKGPEGVFQSAQVDSIVSVLTEIKLRAVA